MRCYWHRYANRPRLHLDRACDAIADTPDERLQVSRVTRPRALARRPVGRPCRMCALPAVLEDLLGDPLGARPVRCTVTAHGIDVPDVWAEPSDSATARFGQIVDRFGWPVTASAAGPIAYPVVTRPVAVALARNLRCLWDDRPGPHDAATAAVVWSLAGQFHGKDAGTVQDPELWRLAVALCD